MSRKSGEPRVKSLILLALSSRGVCPCKPLCALQLGCAQLVESTTG